MTGQLPAFPAFAAATVALALLTSVCQAQSGADKVEAGASIYENYCGICHGERLRNTSGGVTFDLRRLRPEDGERFRGAVLNGKNQMPPWRDVLNGEQIDSIWAYIRANVDKP
jgi:mono/diheme cytochrome c family protein